MKKILIAILLSLIIIIIIKEPNKERKNNITNNYNTTTQINQNDKIEIISNKHTNKSIIELIIKNKTDKEINEVVIQATCYDKNGNNLGVYTNGQYNINTKDTYKIEIYCNYETQNYKLDIKTK